MNTSLALLGLDFGVDLITAIRQNDVIGWACILLLIFLSFHSGYYIFSKYLSIRHAMRESEDFVADCLEGHKSLHEIYQASHQYASSPLAALLRESYLEYEMEIRQNSLAELSLEQRVMLGKNSVESALERTIAAEMRRLESRLVYLATASTLAPFVGLFGTVWGILGAFQALGNEGSASIATLAPGVSTALVTTIFGLIVAIPSAAMYNYLSSSVAHLSSQMDSFAHELTNVFQKHLLRRE
ncbi:MotA/TolQ/ExbB proton channel family protein [Candidatus Poribacteria bacterium]|nr:MotA/TolQ/ExbB proton channel family protein [Candidatus Poribacteria bacterium]